MHGGGQERWTFTESDFPHHLLGDETRVHPGKWHRGVGGGHSVERPCKVPRVRQIQVQTLSPPSAVGARENNGASLSLNDLS